MCSVFRFLSNLIMLTFFLILMVFIVSFITDISISLNCNNTGCLFYAPIGKNIYKCFYFDTFSFCCKL